MPAGKIRTFVIYIKPVPGTQQPVVGWACPSLELHCFHRKERREGGPGFDPCHAKSNQGEGRKPRFHPRAPHRLDSDPLHPHIWARGVWDLVISKQCALLAWGSCQQIPFVSSFIQATIESFGQLLYESSKLVCHFFFRPLLTPYLVSAFFSLQQSK